jgi:hypothetical protein
MELDFVADAPLELWIRELIDDDESILNSMDDHVSTASREWFLELHCCMDVFMRWISA